MGCPCANARSSRSQILRSKNHAGVASSEMLVHSIRNLTLPRLGDLILDHHEVGAIRVDVIQMEPARENFSHQIRAIESFLRSLFPPPCEPFSGVSTRERYGPNLEMDVVFVVHGNFEDEKVRPLDLSVHHLAVQVVDIRHAEVSGDILTVGKSHIALDAPFALLDGNHRIALDDLIARRLSVPVVDETHVGVIQGVVDVVEVIANAIQTHHVQADLRPFKLRIPRQRRWVAFAHIREDQTQIFGHGITRNLDFVREGFRLGRLLHTLTGAVVFPTVIEATKAVSFDPSHRQLRAPVRATKADHVRRPALTAIQRKIFSENADRHGRDL